MKKCLDRKVMANVHAYQTISNAVNARTLWTVSLGPRVTENPAHAMPCTKRSKRSQASARLGADSYILEEEKAL